ncbi:MAG: hypothetical protein QM730_19930 [Anaerolineales bacterium]
MTKKNRKNIPPQNMEEETGASESPIESGLSNTGADAEVDAVRASLIEAEQTEPELEPDAVEVDAPTEMVETSHDTASSDEEIQVSEQEAQTNSSEDHFMDDLLADVRQSLLEEDDTDKDKGEKKSSWWNWLVKAPPSPATPTVDESEDEAPVAEAVSPVLDDAKTEPIDDVEEIDELIKLLETEELEDDADLPAQPTLPPVEEVKIDVEELKKQAFAPRMEGEATEELSDVRKVALAGEEDVFVEVEAKKEDPLEERIKSVENALRPYRTYIYYGLAFIGVVMAIMASVLIYNGVKQSMPTPVATEAPNMPYPVMVSLPGGLNFNLAKGSLKDGSWDPRGPEWLQGTEICRWVALPWSRQLEAAVRTMNRDDEMQLVMSNNDKISYKVESIQELTPS